MTTIGTIEISGISIMRRAAVKTLTTGNPLVSLYSGVLKFYQKPSSFEFSSSFPVKFVAYGDDRLTVTDEMIEIMAGLGVTAPFEVFLDADLKPRIAFEDANQAIMVKLRFEG